MLFVFWLALAMVTLVATAAAWARRERSDFADWRLSLEWWAVGALPGVVLFFELMGRAVVEPIFGARSTPVYDYPSTLLGMFWILVGPVLFIFGFGCRPNERLSLPVAATGLTYFMTWATSSLTSLMFASTI